MTYSRHMNTFATSLTPLLGEIASLGTITNYDATAVVHELNDPLSTICFVLRGRLKTVRVDSRGKEQLYQIFERGEQYGMMLGGIGESISLRIFALEPSTILSLANRWSCCFCTPTCAANGYRVTPAACGGGSWNRPLAGADDARDAAPIPGDAQPGAEDH